MKWILFLLLSFPLSITPMDLAEWETAYLLVDKIEEQLNLLIEPDNTYGVMCALRDQIIINMKHPTFIKANKIMELEYFIMRAIDREFIIAAEEA